MRRIELVFDGVIIEKNQHSPQATILSNSCVGLP
jgi:hypothetical protein